MTHRRAVLSRARVIALGVALGFSITGTAFAAQYQSAAQYQAAQRQAQAQYQAAQRHGQAAYQTPQPRQAQAQSQASRTPFLSGLFGQSRDPKPDQAQLQAQAQMQARQRQMQMQAQQQQQQEPQRLGIFGTKPLLSGNWGQETQSRAPYRTPYVEQPRQSAAPDMDRVQINAVPSSDRHGGSAVALTQASANPMEANDALAKIPWELFPDKTRERFQQVASAPTMYRRLPMAGARCNPELFDFFLTYPHTVVEFWKQMDYDKVDMKQVGPHTYTISEKEGAGGRLTILYQSTELTVAHVSGVYRPPGMIRPIEGEAFIVLQVRYTEDPELTPMAICRLDAFINVRNPGADLMARAFQSLIGKIADTNFEQTLAFIDSVSQTAEQDPRMFQGIVSQLSGLSPEARRILANKALVTARQAQQRAQGQLVNYQLLAKANEPRPGYARILSRGSDANASYAANRPSSSFHGYQTPELNDGFFDANDMTSGFAGSRFPHSDRTLSNSFGGSHDFDFDGPNDFSLADDEPQYAFEESGAMMTGEEFLATQSLSSPQAGGNPDSLAKIGVMPSQNARAMNLLDETEPDPDAFISVDSSATLSTDGDFTIRSDDEELQLEELSIESFDLADDDLQAPPAIPLSAAPKAPRAPQLPPTIPGRKLPPTRPAVVSAEPLAVSDSEEVEDEDFAEITIGADGVPVLEFFVDEEESPDSDETLNAETSADGDVALVIDNLDFSDVMSLPEDDDEVVELPEDDLALPIVIADEPLEAPDKGVEDKIDEVDKLDDGGWTRATLANRRAAAKPNAGEKTTPERAKPVTQRYAPPLTISNSSKAVDRVDEKVSKTESGKDGERIDTYRWSPVPGEFVVKTAAIDEDEKTSSSPAKFVKPELR